MESNQENLGNETQEAQKEIKIIVNARVKEWDERTISYEQVVILAFGSYSSDPNVVYTVTYSKSHQIPHEGSLVKGKIIKVNEGMIFNATQTNKS